MKTKVLIIISIILLIVNITFYIATKKALSGTLEIPNINEFNIINVKKPIGWGSARSYHIRFVISKDNFNKNNLIYGDRYKGQSIYEGEIGNFKESFGNYYICSYGKVIYDSDTKGFFDNNIMSRKILFLLNSSLIIIIIISIFKYVKIKIDKKD